MAQINFDQAYSLNAPVVIQKDNLMRRRFFPLLAALAVAMSAMVPSSSVFAQDEPKSNQFWWPERLDLSPLRDHDPSSNPYGEDFDYAKAFASLDLDAVKQDLKELMTTSQDWWPADFGHYGPLVHPHVLARRRHLPRGRRPRRRRRRSAALRAAEQLARQCQPRQGASPALADQAEVRPQHLLGRPAGPRRHRRHGGHGLQDLRLRRGSGDDWEPDLVYWGPETKMLGRKRTDKEGKLAQPLGATQMGLIYVNPEGPGGNPDPLAAAEQIRESFGRMAMNDEETVALIAGGHTFGKVHGAHKPSNCVGPEPTAAAIEEQGLGWRSKCGKGNAEDTVTSGLEGAWTAAPTQFTMMYLTNLFAFEWEQTRSPGGAIQWIPKDGQAANTVPDAHVEGKRHAPIMLTTDLSLKFDPAYREISQRFLENPEEFELAFAKAWFKLTHRDMGPRARYVGAEVPAEALIWQDPVPEVDHPLIGDRDIEKLKAEILDSGLTVPELVRTAWAAAASFRGTDMRGGANGARLRLAPQKDWPVNDPERGREGARDARGDPGQDFDGGLLNRKQVSLADLIVLGGAAAVEKAAKDAGYDVKVPFTPGRGDASQEQTDVESFAVLEPKADGFRNYYGKGSRLSPTESLVDRADLLTLTVPEMTVLVGGMRALDANTGGADYGVFTSRPGTLSNDFFVNLLDMSTKWEKSSEMEGIYEGRDRATGELKWTATSVDLIFGSHSELRAIAEVYAAEDGREKFVRDFVDAWTKVMTLDRFDVRRSGVSVASRAGAFD